MGHCFRAVSKDKSVPAKNGLTLNTAIHLLEALKSFVNGLRSDFEIYEEKGKKKSVVEEYKGLSQRSRCSRRFFDEDPAEEISLSPREKFKVEVYLVIIDKLSGELEKRLTAYRNVENKFGFLSKLANLSNDHIQQAASMLMREYPDFEDHFPTELAHFAAFVRAKTVTVARQESVDNSENQVLNSNVELKMFKLLSDNDCADTFPNVHIALRIYLCMMVSNCSGERSFSRLKRIKSELRNISGQRRVSALSLMSIEHEIMDSLNYQELINDFAVRKSRKRPF